MKIANNIIPTPTIYTLTTDHAASSYRIPVLVDADGNAYGPSDTLPSGESARSFVERIEAGKGELFTFEDGRAPQHAEGIKDSSGDMTDLLNPSPFVTLFLK